MFTQCPDCGTSFRVTAEVLKQAAGQVRCGGCGNAFNSLAYLSEERPAAPPAPPVDKNLPELKPEPEPELGEVPPPAAISAEQSAALLKTLDQLAGEDIRLEDTGVEWRVLDEEEESEDGVDELLDDSPTPVDEFLTKTPTEVEAGEIFEPAGEPASKPAKKPPTEELRFDDNTGIPDDFDPDDLPSSPTPDPEPEPEPAPEEPQVELALGDPDEWGELLDEVAEPADTGDAAAEDPPELEEDDDEQEDVAAASVEDSADTPLDIDAQFGMQAEAMGIDLSGVHEAVDEDFIPQDTGALELELANAQQAAEEEPADEEEPIEVPDEEDDEDSVEEQLEELDDDADEETSIDDDLIAAAFEKEEETEAPAEQIVPEPTEEEMTVNMQIDEELLAIAVEDDDGFASTIVIEDKKKADIETMAVDSSDEDVPGHELELELEFGDDSDESGGKPELPFDEDDPKVETIIMEGDFVRTELEKEKLAAEREARDKLEDPGFIAAAKRTFRGKFVRDNDAPEDGGGRNWGMIAAAAGLALLLIAQVIHQSRFALATVPGVNDAIAPIYRAVGAPITPEWDVAGWRFEVTKGTTATPQELLEEAEEATDVDDLDPLADIIAEGDEVLTIYSRIGNDSDGPLPYPLISVSLTDRFEEVIGSKVLEPAQYLTGDFDPRIPVAAGGTFNAVISIESPAPEANGFKLNVCYRVNADQIRCAIENFK